MNYKSVMSLFIVLTLVLVASGPVMAQNPEGTSTMDSGPRKQLATIVFSGLAGAVLGLSTLSFYGRPQDKLSNIAVGFAIGIIAGTVYTTYKQATRPYGATEIESQFYFAELDIKDSATNPLSNGFGLSQQWSF